MVTGSRETGGFGFDPDTIWVTVFHDDDEAADLWKQIAGLPDERIQRRGWKDNFWSTGPSGPVGSVLGDLRRPRPQVRRGGQSARSSTRTATWRSGTSSSCSTSGATGAARRTSRSSGDLKQKNIDTGMGLERVAYLLQGVDNLYEIDEVFPVIQGVHGNEVAHVHGQSDRDLSFLGLMVDSSAGEHSEPGRARRRQECE